MISAPPVRPPSLYGRRLKTLLLTLAFAAPCTWLPTAARAESLLVGPKGVPGSLAAAIERAQDGDVIELLPGEYLNEPVLIEGKRLTLRGMGKRPVLTADRLLPAGLRGLLVVRNADVTVENLEFRGARAADAGGAGIRFESGRLRVRGSEFFDNESGIVTEHAPAAQLDIESSIFGLAPRVVGGLHHLLSVGRIGRLTVSGSRFHQGFEGHMLKSRAAVNDIRYNVVYDGTRGGASYEIDLPNGGQAWLVGNVIGQATTTQNPVVVAYGAEGSRWPRNALYMSHNTLINHQTLPAWFLRVWRDRLPPSTEIVAVNNLTTGGGVLDWGASGDFAGNLPALQSVLRDPGSLDFAPWPDAWVVHRGIDPRNVHGQDLSPKYEFSPPVGVRKIEPRTAWTAGAFQP